MSLVEVAAALIRDERGRYLIAQRAAGAPHAGLWEFPGGKRHAGESLEECLRRELTEELGARFHVGERIEVVVWPETDPTIALSFYRCLHEDGAIEARAAQTAIVVTGSAALVAPLGCSPEPTAHPRVVYETATYRPLTPPLTHTTAPAAAAAANAPIADTGPIRRITAVSVRIPTSWQTPPLVGRLQHHRIVPGENLLEIARAAGLGFREVRDANPTIDEWEPHAGVDILLPSRAIL